VAVLRPETLRRIIREHLASRNLPASTAHGLRHSAVTKVLDVANGNLRLAASFARHSDLRQLARYDDGKRGQFNEAANLVADAIQ
jgi:integrase